MRQLPYPYLPGADKNDSLAQAQQANNEALAGPDRSVPIVAAVLTVAVSLAASGAGTTTVTLPGGMQNSTVRAVGGGFQGASGAMDRVTWGWQTTGADQLTITCANNFAGSGVTGTLILVVYA